MNATGPNYLSFSSNSLSLSLSFFFFLSISLSLSLWNSYQLILIISWWEIWLTFEFLCWWWIVPLLKFYFANLDQYNVACFITFQKFDRSKTLPNWNELFLIVYFYFVNEYLKLWNQVCLRKIIELKMVGSVLDIYLTGVLNVRSCQKVNDVCKSQISITISSNKLLDMRQQL